MGDRDTIARLPAVLWRAVMAVTGVIEWRSLPASVWDTVTRHVSQGVSWFLLGVGLVTMVLFAFVALAILS